MPTLIELPIRHERSAESIDSFVKSVGGKVSSFEGAERRAHERYVVAIPSIVQPLDDQLQPEGKHFNAATRDISVGGIGLVHTQPVAANFLDVRLMPVGGREIRLLVKVLRCRPLGDFYDIAGEFVTSSK